jgi:hypothetical protein
MAVCMGKHAGFRSAESFLPDFPFEEFPYLMEHVRQHVADRPQGRATTSSGST